MRKPLKLKNRIYIAASASVAGRDEAAGPLGGLFDVTDTEGNRFGEDTWEKAESAMQRMATDAALRRAGYRADEIDALFAGDLLDQCVGSNYAHSGSGIPYLGLYGACSTAAEGLILAALACEAGLGVCAAVTSSHFCTAERQFRFPLEYGGQRTPTSQWTVTGAGAFILSRERRGGGVLPRITEVMAGRIVDRGISDLSNMGAAMAPAAADTLLRYFGAGADPSDFDLIITGDLGREGTDILRDLCASSGLDIAPRHADCGLMIYDGCSDKHAGGSGCGCSAAVMAADVLVKVREGALKNVLFLGTGALMSPVTVNQGSTIPGIAHLVRIAGEEG